MRRLAFTFIIVAVFAVSGGLSQTPEPSQASGGLPAGYEVAYNAGRTLRETGDVSSIRAAVSKFKDAARIARDAGAKYLESIALRSAGEAYKLLDDNQNALKSFADAHDIAPADKESFQADCLREMGLIFAQQGAYAKALALFVYEREIRVKLKDVPGEVGSLHNSAMVLNDLGDMQKAKTISEEILKYERQPGVDRHNLSATINNLAYVYYRLEDYNRAAQLYQEAFEIGDAENYGDVRSATQIGLGDSFHMLNEEPKALTHYERGLALAREIGNTVFQGDALWGIGTIYQNTGEKEKARQFYQRALVLQSATGAREQASKTLSALMSVWLELGQPQVAILYGKRSVNLNQEMRSEMKTLSKETQRLYIRSKEKSYRQLSNILIAEGRLPEAQGVLDLLKEQEYEQFTKLRSGETPDTVPYSKAENETVTKIDGLAALTSKQAELEDIRVQKGSLSIGEQAELKRILEVVEAANRAFRLSLDALRKSDASVGQKILDIQTDKNLQAALGDLRTELSTGVVALYTVIGTDDDKQAKQAGSGQQDRTTFGWVIMVTPEGRKAYSIDVDHLQENVQQFRAALSSPAYDPKPLAQKLYTAIFRQTSPKQTRTLENDLDQVLARYKDKTVMWSLDGVLRYVPMSALNDGKNYLVEKYRNTVFTHQSAVLLSKKDASKWETLGLGVSEDKTIDDKKFIALDGAKRELEDIVREPNEKTGILDGTRKLNKDFTKDATFDLLREGKYQAVHIASHFSFDPVDPSASFLVIGDGKLTFADFVDKDNLLRSVDLLTLSACDTAMSSNGKESEGFPFLAQSLGAKTVIASLWKVSDTGTPELMIRFYKLRAENPTMSKGEAFRQAQLSLLTGTADVSSSHAPVKAKRSEPISLDGSGVSLQPYTPDPAKPFAHPHYWASFVLIGNWR
jgi:CHAT domain-containing protein